MNLGGVGFDLLGGSEWLESKANKPNDTVYDN